MLVNMARTIRAITPRTFARCSPMLINQARADVKKVNDAKAQALCETTAEVLTGLRKAYDDYEQKNEEAWKKAS